jgi:hypothetical protein
MATLLLPPPPLPPLAALAAAAEAWMGAPMSPVPASSSFMTACATMLLLLPLLLLALSSCMASLALQAAPVMAVEGSTLLPAMPSGAAAEGRSLLALGAAAPAAASSTMDCVLSVGALPVGALAAPARPLLVEVVPVGAAAPGVLEPGQLAGSGGEVATPAVVRARLLARLPAGAAAEEGAGAGAEAAAAPVPCTMGALLLPPSLLTLAAPGTEPAISSSTSPSSSSLVVGLRGGWALAAVGAALALVVAAPAELSPS